LAGGSAILYFFPPEKHSFYPRCLLNAATGLECPGCGGLRAAHQLLHGHLAAAFALNPLLVTGLPVLGLFLTGRLAARATGRDWLKPFRHVGWIWFLVGVILVFGVGRNLPWFRHV
jgi:Protein of unknown function (DUF2752)